MTLSPTQLSLRYLRAAGYTAEVVEHWNPHARVRHDLFDVVDVLALQGRETLAVQTTSSGNVPARVRKIRASANLPIMREAGWRVVVHGWKKLDRKWTLTRAIEL